MPWFKVDDGFHNHPKILAVGNSAAGLFVRFGSYCSQQTTDGFVPETVAKMYGKRGEIESLLAQELLEKVTGGYKIPDFLDFNPSAEAVRERRARTAERVAEWRAKQTTGNADVTALHKRSVPGGVTGAPTRPDPTPLNTSTTRSSSVLQSVPDTTTTDDDYQQTIKLIVDAKEAEYQPTKPKAWRHKVHTNTHLEDGELIRSMLTDGTAPDLIALFVLGHGTTAEKERTETAWCNTDCDCDGDGWIHTNQGLAPCPQRAS